MSENPLIGKRVQIKIDAPSTWTRDAFRCLNEAVGVVSEATSPTDSWGRPREVIYTVTFDPALAGANGPIKAFHFAVEDFAVVDG